MESGPGMTRDEVVALLADRGAVHAALLGAKDAEIAAKDALISQLSARIDALEAAARKNSSISSKPPSSDDPNDRGPAKKRSCRRKSGRQRGKQPGSSGMTLRLVGDPDDTVECPPRCCGGCGLDLAEAEVFAEQRRLGCGRAGTRAQADGDRVSGAVQGMWRVRERDRGGRAG